MTAAVIKKCAVHFHQSLYVCPCNQPSIRIPIMLIHSTEQHMELLRITLEVKNFMK